MKKVILLTYFCFGFLTIAFAQRKVQASAISIQLPIARNSQISIRSEAFNLSQNGNQLYVANMFPGIYTVSIKNGRNASQISINLRTGTLVNVYVGANGQLIQEQIRNPNRTVLINSFVGDQSFDIVADYWRDGAVIRPADIQFDFNDWFKRFSNWSFDKDKLKFLNSFALTPFKVTELIQIFKAFDSDDARLSAYQIIKNLVIDPQNLYKLEDTFVFIKGKEAFMSRLKERNLGLSAHQRPYAPISQHSTSNFSNEESLSQSKKGSFETWFGKFNDQNFDDGKNQFLKEHPLNSITSEEAIRILKQFAWDEKRFIAAKYLLPLVVDVEKSEDLASTFKFTAEKKKFLEFHKTYRDQK